MGLDAVHAAVKRMGGDIRLAPTGAVSTNGFCGAAYEITLPQEVFCELKASKSA